MTEELELERKLSDYLEFIREVVKGKWDNELKELPEDIKLGRAYKILKKSKGLSNHDN